MRRGRRDEVLVNISDSAFSPDPSDQAWAEYGAAAYESVAALADDETSEDTLRAVETNTENCWDAYSALAGTPGSIYD